jgi:hypothetical protein
MAVVEYRAAAADDDAPVWSVNRYLPSWRHKIAALMLVGGVVGVYFAGRWAFHHFQREAALDQYEQQLNTVYRGKRADDSSVSLMVAERFYQDPLVRHSPRWQAIVERMISDEQIYSGLRWNFAWWAASDRLPELDKVLMSTFKPGTDHSQEFLVEALENYPTPAVRSFLIKVLTEEGRWDNRRGAAYALAEMPWSTEDLAQLTSLFDGEEHIYPKIGLAYSLRRHGSNHADDWLKRTIETHKNDAETYTHSIAMQALEQTPRK